MMNNVESLEPKSAAAEWKNVETVTLDDKHKVELLKEVNKPIRVLVTMHSIHVFHSNLIKNGLGLWVLYILKKYFRMRNIPVKLYLKSIVVGGLKKTDIKDVLKFIKRKKVNVLIPSDVTDTKFVARHYDKLSPFVRCAVSPNVAIYEQLEDKWEAFKFCQEHGLRK